MPSSQPLSGTCRCCFGATVSGDVVSCSSGHSVCAECAVNYVNKQIGERKFKLECPASQHCKSELVRSQVNSFLDQRSLKLLNKIQRQAETAALPGYEPCPACVENGRVIEDTADPIFRCVDEECGKLSCRLCKAEAHSGSTCAEAAVTAALTTKLSALHVIEEAMTDALAPQCPTCKRRYVKESGCNHIHCDSCQTWFCDICGAVGGGHGRLNGGVRVCDCAVYDDDATRRFNKVEHARRTTAATFAPDKIDSAQVEKLKLTEPPRGRTAVYY